MAKRTKILIFVIAIVALIFFGGRWFIFHKIKTTLEQKITDLEDRGIHVKYSSLSVNSLDGSVSMDDINVNSNVADSVCGPSGRIKHVSITGISILPVLLNKELRIGAIKIEAPFIHYKKFKREKTYQKNGGGRIRGIDIGEITIDAAQFENVDSASCRVGFRANFHLAVDHVKISNLETDSMSWKTDDLIIGDIVIELPTKFYKLTLDQIAYDHSNQTIQLDSLILTPTVDKLEFAKKVGKQVDQFTCFVPSLKIAGFDIDKLNHSELMANHVDVSMTLEVYRDKRFERKPRKKTILPAEFLHKLPYALHIDSLTLSKSFVSYQERPEKGDESGKIFFDKLTAKVYNISNDSTGEARMNVYSRFMDAGELNASFTFPLAKHKLYAVNGALTKFAMPQINSMLTPVANIKINSGEIQAMKFNFQYDNVKSNGTLEMRYDDLKVEAVHPDDKSTNKLATFLINALVKTKIDKNDPKDKRTGTIEWERDTQKSILNLWWKSILSGVKSVFGVDKFLGKGDKSKKK